MRIMAVVIAGCCALTRPTIAGEALAPPLVDGDCGEYPADAGASPPRPRFRLGGARELQLMRQRFGPGEWRLVFELQRVRRADGRFADLRFPEQGTYRVPALPAADAAPE